MFKYIVWCLDTYPVAIDHLRGDGAGAGTYGKSVYWRYVLTTESFEHSQMSTEHSNDDVIKYDV